MTYNGAEQSKCSISAIKMPPTFTISGTCNFTADTPPPSGSGNAPPGTSGNAPPGTSGKVPAGGSTYELPNFLGVTDPNVLINRIIKAIIGVTGSAALVIFIYGGFLWLTSMGDPGKVKEGTGAMKWAAIGLVVIFSSYILINFILTNILASGK